MENKIKIPKGYKKLRVGHIVRKSDKFLTNVGDLEKANVWDFKVTGSHRGAWIRKVKSTKTCKLKS
jgi:hypothetical protein